MGPTDAKSRASPPHLNARRGGGAGRLLYFRARGQAPSDVTGGEGCVSAEHSGVVVVSSHRTTAVGWAANVQAAAV